MARKSNREKKNDRELKHKFKELDKVIDRQAHIITANNILLTCTNMLSTEYIRYIKQDDPELLNNTFRSSDRIKRMLSEEHKMKRVVEVDLKEHYKTIRAYLKGINKRIGDMNDNKNHDAIVMRTEVEFNKAEKIIKESKSDNIYDFIIGKELSTYYVHTMYAITIIDNIIDKVVLDKKVIKYIKGAITRIKNIFEEIEGEIKRKHDDAIREWDKLEKSVKIKYLLVRQCELEGIKADKGHKRVWGTYAKEISSYNEEQLKEEYESTLYLINKAS